MNGGTRRSFRPGGDGSRPKEEQGNRKACVTARLCRALQAVGGFWTIENPQSSFLFQYAPIAALYGYPGVSDVCFDQCEYELRPPGGLSNQRVKKPTRLLGNVPGLSRLARRCSHTHEHVHALGSVRVNGQRVSRARAAGAYPPPLCSAIAATVARAIQEARGSL